MELKHTPGPWKVENRPLRYAVNSESRHIAMVSCMEMKKEDREENEANALLIAAAPEMLKVLIRFYKGGDMFRGALEFLIESATGLPIEEVLK